MRAVLGFVVTVFALSVPAPLQAQSQLVKDINTLPAANPSSSPARFAKLGNDVLFVADTWNAGHELMRSRGTAATTQLVKDIWPGRGASTPADLTVLGNAVYFSATDGTSGRELWRTQGTAATTVQVKDLRSGANGSNPRELIALGNLLLFTAEDGAGRQLFKSDGTAAGTTKVHGGPAQFLHAAGSYVWFSAGTPATAIWRTDGTAAGTVEVMKLAPFQVVGRTWELGGKYYFAGCTGLLGAALWISDGTAAGTRVLKNLPFIPYCSGGTAPGILGKHKGLLWLSVNSSPAALWKSDGTANGTVQVKALRVRSFMPYGNHVYFHSGAVNVDSLWRSDGTATGTTEVKKLSAAGFPILFRAAGRLWFMGYDTGGRELWTSDGTGAGTYRVADIRPGPEDSWPSHVHEISSSEVLFDADDGTHGRELWKSDATAAGTKLVADLKGPNGTLGSDVLFLTDRFGTAFFSADDGVNGRELWKSDGTTAGTKLVKDIEPGAGSSSPDQGLLMKQKLFFRAFRNNEPHLFVTDGTGTGTLQLTASPQKLVFTNFTAMGDHLYYAVVEASGIGLYRTDGTRNGAERVFLFRGVSPWALELTTHGRTIFFVGNDTTHGQELWKTDGTTLGTVLVKDTRAGATGLRPDELTPFGSNLLFAASSRNGAYRSLWISDGTTAGTHDLADRGDPRDLTVVRDRVFFTASWRSWRGLFVTDGVGTTNLGETQVRGGLAALGDKLVFAGFSSATGTEPWISDGTLAGTRLIEETDVGPWGLVLSNFVPVGSRRLAFLARTRVNGDELWLTDGTAQGTKLLEDIHPGAGHGLRARSLLQLARGTMFLAADNGRSGIELYRTFPGATARPIGQPCGDADAELSVTDPALGQVMTIAGERSPTSSFGVAVIGIGQPFEFGGCTSYVLLQLGELAIFRVVNADWQIRFPIPNEPGLDGVTFTTQMWYLPTRSAAGFDLSNAVELTVGR